MEQVAALARIPERPSDGHKGTFGTVCIIAGCAGQRRMIGAPIFAARGAVRAGAGLVQVVSPEPICNTVLSGAPHATAHAIEVDQCGEMLEQPGIAALDAALRTSKALVIGPGLGNGEVASRLTLRAVAQDLVPVVVDADALNALAGLPGYSQEVKGRVIFTPHPGEFRRLSKALGLDAEPVDDQSRQDCAGDLARRLGCVVVLKGASSVVSDGQRFWVCHSGHPCLATGGTGDVLAGVLGGLIAQFDSADSGLDLFMLACLAVEAHARAGARWAKNSGASAGLVPFELADLIPAQIEGLRSGEHG